MRAHTHTQVGSMGSGMSFGEKALENNMPRAATVTTTTPAKLLILRASEYKNLVASAQVRMIYIYIYYI